MRECVYRVDVAWKPGNSGEYTLYFLCDVKKPFCGHDSFPSKEWHGRFSCVKTLTSVPSVLSNCYLMRDHPYHAEITCAVDTAPGEFVMCSCLF